MNTRQRTKHSDPPYISAEPNKVQIPLDKNVILNCLSSIGVPVTDINSQNNQSSLVLLMESKYRLNFEMTNPPSKLEMTHTPTINN